jgi:ATP-binding cassette subfamily B protein RaxB
MIACFHGYVTDLASLRQRFGMSLKGATLKQLMTIAEALGFNARPLRGEIEELPHLSLPAVLHWDLNHFVVLTRISEGLKGKRYHINDPSRGNLVLSREEVSRRFTGVALDLLKSESFQPSMDATRLQLTHLWSSMSGFWRMISGVVLLSLILQLVALAAPFYLQIAIDTVFPSFDRDLLLILALGFGGLAVIGLVTNWLRSLILVSLNSTLSYQIVVNLFRHLLKLPLPWFEKRHVGDIISRFGSTKPLTQLLTQGMIAAFIDGLMAITTLVLMFVYSPMLALIALAALGFYTLLRFGFLQSLRLRNINVITTSARENSAFIESVRGIAAIKAFGQENNRRRLWQRAKADAVNAEIAMGRLNAGFEALGQFVIAAERIVFVYVAVSLALDGGFTTGMLFAFQAYKQQFLDTTMRLVEQGINYRLMGMHLARISDIAVSKPEDAEAVASSELPNFDEPIDVANLWFTYASGETPILRGANLRVEPGEMVALVGPSGGGKTTLLKIMMGLFEPTAGQVRIGGRPLTGFSRSGTRTCIGSVAQDDELYAGSLAENISFFDPELDMDQVEAVARLAMIHDDICAMPMRYHTLVGDMGSVLSGGQKQRILLARALYGRPRILFMDEGTSHLDPETEAAIVDMLSGLPITRIVSTHSPLVVRRSNRAFSINQGVLTREGLPKPSGLIASGVRPF